MPGRKKANQRQASAAERIPPRAVQLAAARGLAWRAEYGRGGTAVGFARARDLSNGRAVSWETVDRMYRYFLRHKVDLDAEGAYPGERGFPSPGRVAWELWGGDAGLRWVLRLRRLRPERFE